MHKGPDTTRKLVSCLRELRLSGIAQGYAEATRQAEKESLGYTEYLLELVERECAARGDRRRERYLQKSNLPREKTLEAFDLQRLPQKVTQQVRQLREGSFIDHRENVLVFGNPGSGKTHLLCALGHELVQKERKVCFTTCSILVQELLKAKRALELPRMIKRMGTYEALIIDDLGYVQQDRAEMEVLFTLLAERYERGSVLLSSNLAFSKWESIFKDPMVTAAAIDRLVHHSVILELNVPSYRMAAAKARKGGTSGRDKK